MSSWSVQEIREIAPEVKGNKTSLHLLAAAEEEAGKKDGNDALICLLVGLAGIASGQFYGEERDVAAIDVLHRAHHAMVDAAKDINAELEREASIKEVLNGQ
jgi:enolase